VIGAQRYTPQGCEATAVIGALRDTHPRDVRPQL
jgi:hypothetical protein